MGNESTGDISRGFKINFYIISNLLVWEILNFICETCAKNKKHLQN